MRFIGDTKASKALVYLYKGNVCELDLENKISKNLEEINVERVHSSYNTLWAQAQDNFAFKLSKKKVRISNNEYEKIKDFDTQSQIRHIIDEDSKNILFLCVSNIYRFNCDNKSFNEITKYLNSNEIHISSGIVVNGYLLLDIKEKDDSHKLYLLNLKNNKICNEMPINLKTKMYFYY